MTQRKTARRHNKHWQCVFFCFVSYERVGNAETLNEREWAIPTAAVVVFGWNHSWVRFDLVSGVGLPWFASGLFVWLLLSVRLPASQPAWLWPIAWLKEFNVSLFSLVSFTHSFAQEDIYNPPNQTRSIQRHHPQLIISYESSLCLVLRSTG